VKRVVTAAEVEAAAQEGASLLIDDDTIVTPLARDRAEALGVSLGGASAAAVASRRDVASTPGPVDVKRLVLESRVRMLARRKLLARGEGLAGLEDLVAAVMERLGCGCGCERGGGA